MTSLLVSAFLTTHVIGVNFSIQSNVQEGCEWETAVAEIKAGRKIGCFDAMFDRCEKLYSTLLVLSSVDLDRINICI